VYWAFKLGGERSGGFDSKRVGGKQFKSTQPVFEEGIRGRASCGVMLGVGTWEIGGVLVSPCIHFSIKVVRRKGKRLGC